MRKASRRAWLQPAKRAEIDDVAKDVKEKKEARRTALKQGLRDALAACREAATTHDFVRPRHLASVEGVDLLGRLIGHMFGPGKTVSRVQEGGQGVDEEQGQEGWRV